MSMGVRDITNLEELLEVQDDDKIIVIQNGEAKLISKKNAKFGGGGSTKYWVDYRTPMTVSRLDINNKYNQEFNNPESSTFEANPTFKLYHDQECSNPVMPEELEEALYNGLVYIMYIKNGITYFETPIMGAPVEGLYFISVKNFDAYAGEITES